MRAASLAAVAGVVLAAPSPAAAVPVAEVTGGALAISGADPVSVVIATAFSTTDHSLYGPKAGQRTGTPTGFTYLPHRVWAGAAPAPGPGCAPHAGLAPTDNPRLDCPAAQQIDLRLGPGADFVLLDHADTPGARPPIGVHVDGGAGNDGLVLSYGFATLEGGAGDDQLYLDSTGSASGGAGDDEIYIGGRQTRPLPLTVTCGPGDDNVYDDYSRKGPGVAKIDQASCGPVLRPADAPPPSGPDELSFPRAVRPKGGVVRVRAFLPSESGHGTIELRRALSVNGRKFPLPGTRWAPCGKRRAFKMRAGRVVRPAVRIIGSILRRVRRVGAVPCSFHIRGVDDDGERFRRDVFSLVLVK